MNSVTAINSADSIQFDYMKILIAQLQNQNPLEPLDNNEMASQLAQFSQLQQLESMNSNFAEVLATVESSYASSLIGKEVSFIGENEQGTKGIISGIVEQVYKDVDGEISLVVSGYSVKLEEIMSVGN
ncbi:MAG: flagellar hook assembly protein FlgD [Planctomycetota bacterium]|jgi:flagellar basal-body rod modification protein FlgD